MSDEIFTAQDFDLSIPLQTRIRDIDSAWTVKENTKIVAARIANAHPKLRELRERIEDLESRCHSCHDGCQIANCIARRTRTELVKAREALEGVLPNHIRFSASDHDILASGWTPYIAGKNMLAARTAWKRIDEALGKEKGE
jgi:hypothetical protein